MDTAASTVPWRHCGHIHFSVCAVRFFLESSGAGRFFIDLSTASVGKTREAAQSAPISSCLFGMVSGSAVANVIGDRSSHHSDDDKRWL
jgi:TRAP-type C4-dicarboxylate transport system permease large subunit